MQIKESRNLAQIQPNQEQSSVEETLNSMLKDPKIRSALGCPVTRKILDSKECVILDIGDLITSKAVIQAQNAGVLDRLLNSVYKSPTKNTCWNNHFRQR